MVNWPTLSALRVGGFVGVTWKDLPPGALPMPRLPSPVHGHHADSNAWHQARLAYLDFRDVFGADIEQGHLFGRDGTNAWREPEDRMEDGARHQGNDGRQEW